MKHADCPQRRQLARFRVPAELSLDITHGISGCSLGVVPAPRVRTPASPVFKRIAVLDTVSQDGIPAGHGTPFPLFLLEAVLGVEIPVEVSRWIGKERVAECSDIGKPLLERSAPGLRRLVVLATRAEAAPVTLIQSAYPADERLGKAVLEAPDPEPPRAGPVDVEVPEEVVANVESHTRDWTRPCQLSPLKAATKTNVKNT